LREQGLQIRISVGIGLQKKSAMAYKEISGLLLWYSSELTPKEK
jgi:hypothetical protein